VINTDKTFPRDGDDTTPALVTLAAYTPSGERHITHFRKRSACEVRRIYLLGNSVNKVLLRIEDSSVIHRRLIPWQKSMAKG
jgi:hypothetical protein